jgi:hypothetical protein
VPEQFNFAVTLMNVLLVLSQTEFAQIMILSGVMHHLWMQLLPPSVPEEITEHVNSATVSVIFFTWRMLISHLYFFLLYCISPHGSILRRSFFLFVFTCRLDLVPHSPLERWSFISISLHLHVVMYRHRNTLTFHYRMLGFISLRSLFYFICICVSYLSKYSEPLNKKAPLIFYKIFKKAYFD